MSQETRLYYLQIVDLQLTKKYENNMKSILFHCRRTQSRSEIITIHEARSSEIVSPSDYNLKIEAKIILFLFL